MADIKQKLKAKYMTHDPKNVPHKEQLQHLREKLLKSFDKNRISFERCARSPHGDEYFDAYINDGGRDYHIQVTYLGTRKEIKKACAEDERRLKIAFELIRAGIDYKNRALVEKFIRTRHPSYSDTLIEDVVSKAHGIHHPYPFESEHHDLKLVK